VCHAKERHVQYVRWRGHGGAPGGGVGGGCPHGWAWRRVEEGVQAMASGEGRGGERGSGSPGLGLGASGPVAMGVQ